MKRPPQINIATGVSMDYWNEYFAVSIYFYSANGKRNVADVLRNHPIKRYQERFPPGTYARVVTKKNRTGVARLNRLARYTNLNFTDPEKFSDSDFERLSRLVYRTIFGRPQYTY